MKIASLTLLGGISMWALAAPAVAAAQDGHGAHGAQDAAMDHSAHMGHEGHAPDVHAGHGDHAAQEAEAAQADHVDHSAHGAMTDHSAHGAMTDHSAHGAEGAEGAEGGHEAVQAGTASCTAEHAAMGHCTLENANAHLPQIGTNLAAGDAPAPPSPSTWMADAIWGAGSMDHSRHMMMVENGGQTFTYGRVDSEYQMRDGRDGFAMGGQFWYGGDINRVHVRGNLSGSFGSGVTDADIALLYSRPIDAYFNIEGGIKQDVGKGPKRSYASIGVSGLAPYWFETEAAVLLSDKGDVTAHVELEYDQLITQKLVLQPAFEVELSAQNMAEQGKGSGITEVGAALRLRYEFVRAFAPYVGVTFSRKIGGTADYARAAGDKVQGSSFVFGLKTWF